MQTPFRAFRIHASKTFERSGIESLNIEDLCSGDVIVRVDYSSVNYKDALAGTGKGKILRRSPLVGGIDLAGEVVASESDLFVPGDTVLANGSGLSETHDGGYAEYARLPADWLVPMPPQLDARKAMLIGTAGFTAALALQRLRDNYQPTDEGPILVTGATGGVGSFAIDMLNQQGYEVVAMSRKTEYYDYLYSLGAKKVIHPDEVIVDEVLLHKGRWAGAIDNVGGDVLGWLTKTVKPWGNIVSVGMAAGAELQTSTMPFILRGVALLGVTSAACPQLLRKTLWRWIGSDYDQEKLDSICNQEVALEELPAAFERQLAGQVLGRQLVRVRQD